MHFIFLPFLLHFLLFYHVQPLPYISTFSSFYPAVFLPVLCSSFSPIWLFFLIFIFTFHLYFNFFSFSFKIIFFAFHFLALSITLSSFLSRTSFTLYIYRFLFLSCCLSSCYTFISFDNMTVFIFYLIFLPQIFISITTEEIERK